VEKVGLNVDVVTGRKVDVPFVRQPGGREIKFGATALETELIHIAILGKKHCGDTIRRVDVVMHLRHKPVVEHPTVALNQTVVNPETNELNGRDRGQNSERNHKDGDHRGEDERGHQQDKNERRGETSSKNREKFQDKFLLLNYREKFLPLDRTFPPPFNYIMFLRKTQEG